MIFAYLDLLDTSVAAFFVFLGAVLTALLVGIAFHEFSHAAMANALGDPTPRNRGRLSLNPLAHLDPTGTVLLIVGGFGWGKPVPFDPGYMKSPKAGTTLVAAAGPLANLLLAALFAVPLRSGMAPLHTPLDIGGFNAWGADDFLGLFLTSLVVFNLLLFVFNLIPLAPLDGFKVAVGILPGELSRSVAKLEPWGPGVLFLLFAIPFFTGGVSPLGRLMFPAVNAIATALIGE